MLFRVLADEAVPVRHLHLGQSLRVHHIVFADDLARCSGAVAGDPLPLIPAEPVSVSFSTFAPSDRANNPKGAAFLRMFVDVEDAPSADDYGRAFVQLTPDDLADLKSRAELAGLSVSEDRA